jgi:hypothetical protein
VIVEIFFSHVIFSQWSRPTEPACSRWRRIAPHEGDSRFCGIIPVLALLPAWRRIGEFARETIWKICF